MNTAFEEKVEKAEMDYENFKKFDQEKEELFAVKACQLNGSLTKDSQLRSRLMDKLFCHS